MPLTPESAFLLDALAHPDDPVPRLVYADWLEDHGDPRAAWVRQGCEALAAPPGSGERRAARERLRRDLALAGHHWPELDGLVLSWLGLVDVFRYRVAEAVTWCSARGLPFRSPELHTGAVFGRPGEVLPNWAQLVQQVAQRRAAALAAAGRTPYWLAEDCAFGRLLVYTPGLELWPDELRGLTEYLDGRQVPGWDTWLAFAREPAADNLHGDAVGYLLAWVPPHLTDDVAAAMQAGPATCLTWAEQADFPFVHRLREAGLVV